MQDLLCVPDTGRSRISPLTESLPHLRDLKSELLQELMCGLYTSCDCVRAQMRLVDKLLKFSSSIKDVRTKLHPFTGCILTEFFAHGLLSSAPHVYSRIMPLLQKL